MRSARIATSVKNAPRSFSARTSFLGQSDYGSSSGDAAIAQDGNKNPKQGQEHPGPSQPEAAKNSSSGSSSQPQQSSGQSSNKAQPKIHSQSQPKSESADVKKHNEEFAKREGKQSVESTDEKVDSKYWKGEHER